MTRQVTSVIRNGGFEDGDAPWVRYLQAHRVRAVSNAGGLWAEELRLSGATLGVFMVGDVIAQKISLETGREYVLTMEAWKENFPVIFDSSIRVHVDRGDGNLVEISGSPLKTPVGSEWFDVRFPAFTACGESGRIAFEIYGQQDSYWLIDDIAIELQPIEADPL